MLAGTYSAGDLIAGVNLAAANTPQNKQASQIAVLNAKRHRITGELLRCISMMEHGQLKHNFPPDQMGEPRKAVEAKVAKAGNAAEAQRVRKSFDAYLEYKANQSQLTREGEKLTEQIFIQNKPVWHQYCLERTTAAAAQPRK